MGSIVFTLLLFYYLARIVDTSTLPSLKGLDSGYFAYVAVGLALVRILYSGLSSFANQLREEQTTGTFETLMATPASPSALILGSGAYDLIRGTAFGVVIIAASAAFFHLRIDVSVDSGLVVTGALFACLFLFAALGVVLAAFTVVFKQTTAVLALATSGIALIGGVYFPIELLPGALRSLAELLPFTWGLEVLRGALLTGHFELGRLGLLVAFDAVALPVSLVVFNAALRHARRTGTLAQY